MFKLPIPTRLTDYLGEAVVWTVICRLQHKTALGFVSDRVSPGENPEGPGENPEGPGENPEGRGEKPRGSGREKPAVRGVKTGKPGSGRKVWYLPQA